MIDQISFPPLLDLFPGELEAQKRHLLTEIAQQPERRWSSLPGVPPLRLRFALPAVAAVGVAVAVAVAATGTFGGGPKQAGPKPLTVNGDAPQAPMLVNRTFTAGTLSSVTVTVNPDIADASVRVQVLHSDATTYANAYAAESAGTDQVVFQEQGSATNTPSAGAAGASTWSSTLSPSDWNGGCQSGLYRIAVVWVRPGTLFANPASSPNSGGGDQSSWFSCSGS